MIIPIPLPRFQFREYPLAPRTTLKSGLLNFFAGWPFFLAWAMVVCSLVSVGLDALFGRKDSHALASLLALVPLYFLLRWVRRSLQRRLDEQARIEAEEILSLGPAMVQERMRSAYRGVLRFWAWSLIAGGLCFLGAVAWSLPLHPADVRTMAGEGFGEAGKVYYIEDLAVIGRYAEAQGGHAYYLAFFTDKDGEAWMISFDPPTRIGALIDGSAEKPIGLSTYVRTQSLSDAGFGLARHYQTACGLFAPSRLHVAEVNGEYICSGGENVLLHSLDGLALTLLFLGSFIMGTGLYLFRQAA